MRKKDASVRVLKLTYSALYLAIALVLPFLTGQIPQIGSMLCPMHIPALLCGFVCGWPWGLAVGFISPLLRSVLFGMPDMFPTAVAMAFELAAYGAASGLLYRVLPKKIGSIYAALVLSMIAGRFRRIRRGRPADHRRFRRRFRRRSLAERRRKKRRPSFRIRRIYPRRAERESFVSGSRTERAGERSERRKRRFFSYLSSFQTHGFTADIDI